MIKHRITWFLWVFLIAGLMLIGACNRSTPTTPNPTDVKDITQGGVLDPGDLTTLVNALAEIRENGGGLTDTDVEGFTLISAFDRWTGFGLSAVVIIQTADEQDLSEIMSLSGSKMVSDLEYPITITAMADGYITQTYVLTNADVIGFGLEEQYMSQMPCWMMGMFDLPIDPGDTGIGDPRLTIGKSTHLNTEWQITGSPPNGNPYVLAFANPYQPAGMVGFLFERTDPFTPAPITADEWDLTGWTCTGYGYKAVGSLWPGMSGAWLLDVDQGEIQHIYTDGNYSIPDSMYDPDSDYNNIVSIEFTPGGWLSASVEFIPYGIPDITKNPEDLNGTYSLSTFNPPVVTDRDTIVAQVEYVDYGAEIQLVDWDPLGATLPDVTFGTPPSFDTVEVDLSNNSISCIWTDTPADGLLIFDLYDAYNIRFRRIYLDCDSTSLPDDLILGSGDINKIIKSGYAKIISVACPDISIDDFTTNGIWANATAFMTSHGDNFVPKTPQVEP
ncbi:MAG: hypothetical protein ABIC40_08090 [bacterium]